MKIVLAYHSWLVGGTRWFQGGWIMLSIQEIVSQVGWMSFKLIELGDFGLLGY